ncbi:amyloid fiber anchoring/assembly protein TapA [Rossellomorea aquimaris]|uniref:amyloid fiber anchoring/assembly protein TapA n=1 Tax=Rossellomorea TaxID=2837508 RepID=UPI0016535D6B|nr:amyloid fiber anchoring/assembly protein TapA [Rossellomorea vietnamensis]
MRYLRIKRYAKRNQKLIFCSKILLTCYILIFTLSYLNSNTTAYFSDSNADDFIIQAGTWFDGSKLEIVKEAEELQVCPPTEISTEIKNHGFTMIGTTEYEVYHSLDEDPANIGEKVGEGIIQPIKENESFTLTYATESEGSFMFKVLQRPGFDNNYEERTELLSNKIMVNCPDNDEEEQKEPEETQKAVTESKDESKEQPATDPAVDKKEEVKEEKSEQIVEEPAKEEPEQPKEEEKQPEEPVTPPAPEEPQVPVEEPKAKAAETPTIPDPDKKDEKQTEEG